MNGRFFATKCNYLWFLCAFIWLLTDSAIMLFCIYNKRKMSDIVAKTPLPTDIKLHQASRLLEIHFDNQTECQLSCEFLRVYSPSAEVRGHGAGQEVLQLGKEDVNITAIEPIGNYAVKLVFTDGHDTGLYSWDYLYYLAKHYEPMWMDYIAKLEVAGHARSTTKSTT
jgi:DUF971 family protein